MRGRWGRSNVASRRVSSRNRLSRLCNNNHYRVSAVVLLFIAFETQCRKCVYTKNKYIIPPNACNSFNRHISSQLLSGSQLDAGFGTLFFSPTPPVTRNDSSCLSIFFSALYQRYILYKSITRQVSTQCNSKHHSQHYSGTYNKRKQRFVLFEQRPANVGVQIVSECFFQCLQAHTEDIWFISK